MRNTKILEMLNKGQITELKMLLKDEIYADSLKAKPNVKKRYAAMKKYFTYTDKSREILRKPCVIDFEGKKYTSFTNSWSVALTTEPTGEIELFDTSTGNYPDIGRLVRFDGIKKKIDFNKVIAEAKSKGYRLTKSEVDYRFQYVMLYDGTYYKLGLIDITYAIIDDGNAAITYHPYGERMPLTIQTGIGFCMIMPVKFPDGETPGEGITVIEVE